MDDPEGYHPELLSELRHEVTAEAKLDRWLEGGVERFRGDGEMCAALERLAGHRDSRRCLLLLESILEIPALADELSALLRPDSLTAGEMGRYAQSIRDPDALSLERIQTGSTEGASQ